MINIRVVEKTKPDLILPKDINPYNTQLYEILDKGEVDGSYLFADGGQIMYFYNDGSNKLCLGYQTKRDLRGLLSHIKVRPIKGKISVTIEIE